tara:strand:- start:1426 stop:3579 length:2154 start_codon:yes stop_codon:yes gene_type:complete
MNFPDEVSDSTPRQFFIYLSSDNPALMEHLLSKPITQEMGNTKKGKELVNSFKGINSEEEFEDHFEENYPKIFEETIDSIEDAGEQAKKIEKMFANFQLVRKKLQETYSRPKEHLAIREIIQRIINEEGVEADNIQDLYEFLMKKDRTQPKMTKKYDNSKRATFIKELKRELGLNDRTTLVKLKNKLENYFSGETKPSISRYLRDESPNYSFAYVQLNFVIPKGGEINFKAMRKDGWSQNTEKVLEKIIEVTKVVEELDKIKKEEGFEIVFKGSDRKNETTTVMPLVDFPIFYEIVVQSDYVMRNVVRLKRTDKSSMNIKKIKVTTPAQIENYLTVLEMANQKVKVKGTKSKTREQVAESLMFSLNNQNMKGFIKNVYNKKGSQYFMLPLYKQFLSQGTITNPIEKSIQFIKHSSAIDRSSYLQEYLSDKSIEERKKAKARINSGEGAEFKNFTKDYESKIKTGEIDAWDKKGIELLLELDKEHIENEEENLVKIKPNELERFKSSLVSIGNLRYSKEKKYQDLLNSVYRDEEFQDALEATGIPLATEQKQMTATVEMDKNNYDTSLKQAIAQTIGWTKRGNSTMEEYLRVSTGTVDARKKPLTLMKVIYLSNFIGTRYISGKEGGLRSAVKKIDSAISEGLSLDEPTTVQAVDAFAKLLEKSITEFNKKFTEELNNKLNDIVTNKETYYNLYHSKKVLDELIEGNLLEGGDELGNS